MEASSRGEHKDLCVNHQTPYLWLFSHDLKVKTIQKMTYWLGDKNVDAVQPSMLLSNLPVGSLSEPNLLKHNAEEAKTEDGVEHLRAAVLLPTTGIYILLSIVFLAQSKVSIAAAAVSLVSR